MTDHRILVIRIEVKATLSLSYVRNTASSLHDLLGGYLEMVPLPLLEQAHPPLTGLLGVVDDDGIAKRLPLNLIASALACQQIYGPLLITRADGVNLTSLTGEDIERLAVMYLKVVP